MYGHAAAAALVKTACALRRVILNARVGHCNERSGKIKYQPTDLDHFFRASGMASGEEKIKLILPQRVYYLCQLRCWVPKYR